MSESTLLSVTAYVMFYDGSQWIQPDIANGLQCISESHQLSSIQLVRSNHELMFRIIAVRNWDKKRLVNQQIFQRLKYQEATPSFHQWRSESKQVIGLSFPNEHDAKRFYMAIRQVLDNAGNFQQQIHQIETTYQDPNQYQSAKYTHELYGMHINQQQYDETTKLNMNNNNNNNIKVISRNLQQAQNQNNIQQQQQGLLRRASQGSNISSSTGGSGQGQIYAPISLVQQPSSHPPSCNGDVTPSHCPLPQHSNLALSQLVPSTAVPSHPSNGAIVMQQQQPKAPVPSANVPPPPPPPPPDLKNLLTGKQPPSFADQLKHVRLKKNSTGDGQSTTISPSNSAGSSSNGASTGSSAQSKFQSGNQDLISELSDRLNKRKLNVEASTSGNNATRPVNSTTVTNSLKNVAVNSIAASHRKVPSGSSLSSQEDPNIAQQGTSGGDSRQQQQVAQSNENGTVRGMTNTTTATTITPDDLQRVKTELAEEFAREMAKLKQELTQTIREEIAKMTNALR